jgi:hypothetical protein
MIRRPCFERPKTIKLAFLAQVTFGLQIQEYGAVSS